MGATPADQAYLVPKIKLQKVIINQQGVIESIDIPFDTYTKKPMTGNTPIDYKTQFQTPNNVFKGGGSGIKSMSFEFDGETPATAEKSPDLYWSLIDCVTPAEVPSAFNKIPYCGPA